MRRQNIVPQHDPVTKAFREKIMRQRWNKYQRTLKQSEKFESYRDKHPEQWKIFTIAEFNAINA